MISFESRLAQLKKVAPKPMTNKNRSQKEAENESKVKRKRADSDVKQVSICSTYISENETDDKPKLERGRILQLMDTLLSVRLPYAFIYGFGSSILSDFGSTFVLSSVRFQFLAYWLSFILSSVPF